MGSGRDKRKKAKEKVEGPQAGKGSLKTERKTQKNEEKKERRAVKALDGNEDDIDALLAKFELEDKAKREVVVDNDCTPPSARVSASFVAHTAPRVNEILMFGGEYTELTTDKVRVYNDLYIYNTDKGRWRKVTSPQGPAPRSAHQAVIAKGCMYVFGGEFTSPNQERFHHFKELWRLELSSWAWDQLPSKGGPSARSGHRMLLHKNRIILFGGYYDSGRDMRYYNDLWSFDLTDLKWSPLGNVSAGPWPSPRSGCQLTLHGDTMFVFGGYSKSRDDDDPELEHGKAMDDVWALDLNKYTWEKVKKVGMAPGARSSFAVVTCKGRAFLFGGASDNETKAGLDLSSEFHNDLYTFSLEKRRWFAAELRPPAKSKASANKDSHTDSTTDQPSTSGSTQQQDNTRQQTGLSPEMQRILDMGKDKNSPIYKAAVKIQAQFRGYVVRKAYQTYRLGGAISELLYSPAAYGLDMSVRNMPKPKARIGAQSCVVGGTLWLFGGTVEVGDKEVTLDDMWSLNLDKLDGWDMVKENSVGDDLLKQLAGDGSSSYETDDGEGSDDE